MVTWVVAAGSGMGGLVETIGEEVQVTQEGGLWESAGHPGGTVGLWLQQVRSDAGSQETTLSPGCQLRLTGAVPGWSEVGG